MLGRFGPGVLTAGVIALAATFISEHYGGPQFLYALLFGIAFNFLAEDPRTRPGIEFAARTVLRLGVGMLGAQVTFGHLRGLGGAAILLVMGAVAATILFGLWAARRLDRPAEEGVLSGGAVAICGASAALAISAVLPPGERSARFTLLTVVGVTALSTLAMIVYPALAALLDLDAARAGLFLGGTIHDVAQVVGAGYMHSPAAGLNATFVKLLRVAMLVPVVFLVSLAYRRGAKGPGGRGLLLPWFLLVFVALVGINSAGWIPADAGRLIGAASRWCLVGAIAALGVMTSFKDLLSLGWKPIVLLVSETAFLALVILCGVLLLR